MKKELIHFVEWKKIPEEKVESTLDELQSWGVKNIVAHPFWFRNGKEKYVEKMGKRLEKRALLSTAAHALWGKGNECIEEDPAVWQEMIRQHKDFMEELAILGVKTYTLHLGFQKEGDRKKEFAILRRTVDALLPQGEKTGIALALENSSEPLEVIEGTAQLVKEYNAPYLGMCFDNGHAHCYQGGIARTLAIMGEGIVTCHLHDNFGSFDDHNPPGKGNVDWKELMTLLEACPRLQHYETESGEWDRSSWETFRKYTFL